MAVIRVLDIALLNRLFRWYFIVIIYKLSPFNNLLSFSFSYKLHLLKSEVENSKCFRKAFYQMKFITKDLLL
jgi:hypothetical protein